MMTSGKSRHDCLPAETLAKAARGELSVLERGRVADHLAQCHDCAQELKLIEPLGAWAERSATALGHPPPASGAQPIWQWASAAMAIVAGGLLLWNVALQRENRVLGVRATTVPTAVPAPVTSATPAPAAATPDLIANSLIVDLQSDAIRSGGPSPVVVPADAPLVTLILNSDLRAAVRPYRLEIVNAAGTSIWTTDEARLTPFNTFTISLSPRTIAAGEYRLHISRVTGAQAERLESYTLRIQPQRPR